MNTVVFNRYWHFVKIEYGSAVYTNKNTYVRNFELPEDISFQIQFNKANTDWMELWIDEKDMPKKDT